VKYKTKERRAFDDLHRDLRRSFLIEHPVCWFCPMPSQCVHEIGTQGNRKPATADPCCWAASCSHCNEHRLTDYSVWPIIRQLAKKYIYDRDRYDRVGFNRLRGRAPDAITEGEVLLAVSAIYEEEG
jgi:hypothetical protein